MSAKPRTVLGDLADWELPTLEQRMDELISELQKNKLSITLDADTLGEQVHAQLWDRVRKLGATAANEAIAGWMQGLADGCPELCTSFAYLEGDAGAAPLTLVYSVAARDGSRMVLRRIDVQETLLEALRFGKHRNSNLKLRHRRAATVSAHLRALADIVEKELRSVRVD